MTIDDGFDVDAPIEALAMRRNSRIVQ